MAQKERSQEFFAQQLRHLTEELTEMALVAENLFSAAARALVGRDRSLARQVAEGAGVGPVQDESGETVHTRTLDLLEEWANEARNVRSLMMVQQSAAELERIGDHARRIATHALALTDGTAAGVASLGRAAGATLLLLMRAVSLQLRGCAQVLAAPDVERAQAVAAADEALDQVFGGDHFVADGGWAGDVSIPALERAIAAGAYLKDVVPAVCVEIFGEVIAGLKDGIAQIMGLARPAGVQDNAAGQAPRHVRRIADDDLPLAVEFIYSNAHDPFAWLSSARICSSMRKICC